MAAAASSGWQGIPALHGSPVSPKTNGAPNRPLNTVNAGPARPRSIAAVGVLLVAVHSRRQARRRGVGRAGLTPLAERLGRMAGVMPKEDPALSLPDLQQLQALAKDFKITETIQHLQSAIPMLLASPVVLPTACGVLVVALLALRRGRQPWLEALPLRYDGAWIAAYWQRRPLQLLQRFVEVSLKTGAFSDVIFLPLRFFPTFVETSTMLAFFWTARLYWTLDLFLGFITGFYDAGSLELELRRTIRNYLTGWFTFDVAVVCVDWTSEFLDNNGIDDLPRLSRTMRLGKIVRLLRLSRMLKLGTLSESMMDQLSMQGSLHAGILRDLDKALR
eukprot:g16657.t1